MAVPDMFTGFDLIQPDYKHFGDHGIRADILVPQSPHTGKRPVIVRFHGGGLMAGDSMLLEWFPIWLLELAKKHNAIIVSPNYRLLPEASSLELFDDIEDFWTWLHSSTVTSLLASQPTPSEVDLGHILTVGDSAGGLLCICLTLAHPDEIRAAITSYPLVDIASPHFTEKRTIPIMGEIFPEEPVTQHLAQMKPGDIVSGALAPARLPLMFSATQHGYLHKFYNRDTEEDPRRELRYPFERLDQPGAQLPRGGISLLHGIQDSVVPVDGSEKFVAKAREIFKGKPGGDKISLTVRDGEHGFDYEVHLDSWLGEAIQVAVESWLE
ncbi:hypothetical protein PENPOL_c002G00354 [Penicillium polonicum]|uniref:Alpha/beta hydrolase fold-3 domain-containing protein n=1 Tax=Penicillium polonicum TaxID=60169 RepID=A0A1V6NX04_PENPO|nr:hypothetical protein PENPOL_c002G00354 [Penicillium polonicum]